MEEIKFRSCVPEDVYKAVPLMYTSGPSSFDYVFKTASKTSQEFLIHAFQRKGGEFSYDNHYAVLANNKLVGVGAIFSGPRAKKFMTKDFLNIVRFYGLGALPVLLSGLRIEQILKLPTKNEVCLAHLAIAKEKRNKGYGQKLVHFLMDEVKINPSSYFVLDVSEENLNAKRLYEKIGFKVHQHIRSKYKSKYGYVSNFFRMQLK